VTGIADVGGVFPTLTLSRSPIDGHVTGTTLDTVTTSHGLDVSLTTPGFGDLLSVTAHAGTTDLYDAAYTYDDRGRIDTWTESVEGGATRTRRFGYDAAGRLRTVHDITGGQPGTLLEEYAYDGNGNREKAFSIYPGAVPLDTDFPTTIRCTGPSGDTAANAEDQLCEYGGFTYSYNARGQLQSRSDGSFTTTYTYDGLGRLLRVTEPGIDLHYVLDALGRRIGKIRDGNLERGWLYADALNPIVELDGSGNVRATFIYGTRAHVPDAMVLTDGTVYRLITDHVGSVRLVVNASTGEVVQRIDYDAFGRVLQDTNPGFQPFGFAGGLYDDDTGLVRFGARDYDAYSGRWTAKDPLIFGGADANTYAYVGNDPVNQIDPTGTIRWPGDIYDQALQDARSSGLPGPWNGPQDAFRHCLASCESTRENGEFATQCLADANEKRGDWVKDQEVGEHAMDDFNNAIGIDLGTRAESYQDCHRECLGAAQAGFLETYEPGSTPGYWSQ
jgi:RHS repeat-associated protein